MKKIVFALIGLILGVLIYSLFFGPDTHDDVAKDQISLINKVLVSLDQFEEIGDSAIAVSQIDNLTIRFKATNERKRSLALGSPSAELMSEIERLSAELLNKSLSLELSEKNDAADVSAAFEAFIGQ